MPDGVTHPPACGNGGWWIASILSPVLFTCLGVLISLAVPRLESDWTGARVMLPIVGGVLVGAILCVVFAVVSSARGEKRRMWAILVALPCLGGLIWSTAAFATDMTNQARATKARAVTESRRAAIRADPGIVLREHWDQLDQDYIFCYQNSFSDPAVHYSPQQLRQIYDEAPSMRIVVFQHPACPVDFLTAHFPEAWDLALKREYTMLASIAGNPNTPIDLVEQVARAPQADSYAVQIAKRALEARTARSPRP